MLIAILDYTIINDVKTALSKGKIGILFYRTNHINNIQSGFGFRNQKFLVSKEEIETENKILKEFYAGKHPIQVLIDELYTLDLEKVKKTLLNFNYKKS